MDTDKPSLQQQFLSVWNQLGVNQRASIILATLGVLAGIVATVAISSRERHALLYGNLPDSETAEIIQVLNEQSVDHKVGANGAIYVPADKVHEMRMQLASRGLPKGDGVGFEIFDKPNFGISDFVQRANFIRAVQGELSRTISKLDEVDSSRVMIVMPENRLLTDSTRRATASVFVKLRPHVQLDAQAVNSIRFLVANSVEGLIPGQVSVVDNRGNVLSENQEDDSISGLTSNQLSARKSLEKYLSEKAESMLTTVLGPGQAVVRVSADINLDTITRTEEIFDPENSTPRSTTVTDETTESTSGNANSGGAPGTASNTQTNQVAATGTNQKTNKKITESEFEVSKTVSNNVMGAGGVKRIAAAVFIAAKYEGTGAERKLAARSQEELDSLKSIVRSALGIQEEDTTRKDEITLVETSFNTEMETQLMADFESQRRFQTYVEVGKNVGYPLLALALFGLLWRSLKRTEEEQIPLGVPVGQLSKNGSRLDVTDDDEVALPTGNGGRLIKPGTRTGPQVLTVPELSEIVRQNPDNMTEAVRIWLNQGQASQN